MSPCKFEVKKKKLLLLLLLLPSTITSATLRWGGDNGTLSVCVIVPNLFENVLQTSRETYGNNI